MGWHVEVIAPIAALVANREVLAAAAVPVVIDHYGLYGRARPEDELGQALLDLVARPHVWMKLSAPYRIPGDLMRTTPDAAWLAALLGAAPDRCVWGSDWPHTPPHEQQTGPDVALPYRRLDYAAVIEHVIAALPGPAACQSVLVDNPARLYGFAPGNRARAPRRQRTCAT